MDNELFRKIRQEQIKQLKNLDKPNKKLLICFSGIAGSGKTYIAKILEKKYSGVRIRSDDVREIIRDLEIEEEKTNDTTYNYLNWFFNNYNFQNKLIILDKGIDRRYKEIFSLFERKGYEIFTIRLEVPRKIYERRIKEKLGELDENYINSIDRWIKEWESFGKNMKSDIIIENDKDGELDLRFLFSKLEEIIK